MERVGSPARRYRVIRRRKPSVDFALDEFRVLEQGQHLLPDRLVKFVGTDRRVVADGSVWTAPRVDPVASVVMSTRRLATGIPGVPSHGVTTICTNTKPLEKRLLDGLARREAPVDRPLLLRTREDRLVHDDWNG